MAVEIAVSSVMGQLLPLLMKESTMFRGIHNEFAGIKDELESMHAFLKDADSRAADLGEENEGVKTWVKQVTEVAFRIQDTIDDYLIHFGQQQQQSGFTARVHKVSHGIKTLIHRRRIAHEIQDIKSSVRQIKEIGDRYGFKEIGGRQSVRWYDPRTATLYMDEAEVLGFGVPRDRLIGWLVRGNVERTVISVVGMGGLGKTTLAKYVYDDHRVISHFYSREWITVSRSYNVELLLRDLLIKLREGKEGSPAEGIVEMNRDSLIHAVRNCLQQKRYVVVFDDVWDMSFWAAIQFAMVDDKIGSRILITTRSMDVANYCKRSSPVKVHTLMPLTAEQSLELFCKKAFPDGRCPEELAPIASEFVEKCKGLPLAIVVIGGFLATKDTNASEWRTISQHLSSELQKNSNLIGVTKILGFSYDDLPYYLKPCFLYFGMYPEDYEVRSERLIRQWIAEGFVKEENGKTLEEIAEEYLKELTCRSLVQVTSVSVDGKAEVCRVHDMMYEMISGKGEDFSFCRFIGEDDRLTGKSRRLSIASTSEDLLAKIRSSEVRSLLVLTKKELPEHFVTRIPAEFRLKVLDFEHNALNYVPKDIGNLIHLKYLSLRFTKINSLPKSIGELLSLETLDIRGTKVRDIPKKICKLTKLQHLLGTSMSLIQLKNNIGGMASLQTLNEVRVGKDGGAGLIRQLGMLRLLRVLKLIEVQPQHGSTLSSSIKEMKNLKVLHIDATIDHVIDLQYISPTPFKLQDLRLRGKINIFPDWVRKLKNLVSLHLESSRLIEDPLESLQHMPNLLCLHLFDRSYEGERLHFQDGGFQNLKELDIADLHHLNFIVINRGALQSLKMLRLESIPQLKMIPSDIQHLKKLEVLEVNFMSTEFNKSIVPKHHAIKHVPLVRIITNHSSEGIKAHTIHHS